MPGLGFQQIRRANCSACKDFSLLVDEAAFGKSRDWLFDALHKENIDVRRYFWPPVHRQKLFSASWDKRPLPVTDKISESILNLPIYSSLADQDVERVCDAICRVSKFANRNRNAKAQGA